MVQNDDNVFHITWTIGQSSESKIINNLIITHLDYELS